MRDAFELAKDIEQFIFLYGEYNDDVGNRIRWIENSNVPGPHELTTNPDTFYAARLAVVSTIIKALTGTAPKEVGGIEELRRYMDSELCCMDDWPMPRLACNKSELKALAHKCLEEMNMLLEGMEGRT